MLNSVGKSTRNIPKRAYYLMYSEENELTPTIVKSEHENLLSLSASSVCCCKYVWPWASLHNCVTLYFSLAGNPTASQVQQ